MPGHRLAVSELSVACFRACSLCVVPISVARGLHPVDRPCAMYGLSSTRSPHVPCVLLQSRRPETRIRQTATVPGPGSLMHVSLWFPRRIAPTPVYEKLIPSAKLAPCPDSRRLVFPMLPCGGCSNICGVRPLPRREALCRLRTLGSVRTVGDLFCVAPTSVA